MNIDTEHLHHWMRAIRNSKDPMRTMDAFWRGQILSKEWVVSELQKLRTESKPWPCIDIHGGWVGTLASLLFQSELYIDKIKSIDIDPECEDIANNMNQLELEAGRFRAITHDMCTYRSDADIIINTSCEHITQEDFDIWKSGMPHNSLFVLQGNDYTLPDHIRTSRDLDHFVEQCGLEKVLYKGQLDLPLYKRFMVIGRV